MEASAPPIKEKLSPVLITARFGKLLGRTEWWLPFAILASLTMVLLSLQLERQFREFSEKTASDRELVEHISGLLAALEDVETGQRGFLLTGKDEYLEPYRSGSVRISKELEALEEEAGTDPKKQAAQRAIRSLSERKLAELETTIEIRRQEGLEAALRVVQTNIGKNLMDQLRSETERLQRGRTAEWNRNLAQRDRYGKRNFVLTMLGNVILISILLAATKAMRSANRQRDNYLLELAKAKEKVDQDFEKLSRTSEELRISESRVRMLFENASQGILTVDRKGRIISANARAAALFGHQVAELVGGPVEMLLPKSLRERHVGHRANYVAEPYTRMMGQGMDLLAQRKDGSEFPVEISLSFAADEHGGGVAIAFISDVTERKKAEEALRTAHRRLSLATQALQLGIWDWDIASNNIIWDDTMRSMYDVAPDVPIEYEVWANAVLPQDLPQAEAALQKAVASHSRSSMDFRIRRSDGSIRHIEAVFEVKTNEKGEAVTMIGTNLDVTDRKAIERAVHERSAELQTANRELEEFTYVASHDLKAPLRVIENASRWLEEDLEEHLSEETRENMDLLQNRVKRMEKLLDDLLEYARIGRTTDNRYAEIVQGDDLMNDVIALLAPNNFVIDLSPNFANIRAPRMPLQQIFLNLIGNAIKHHDKKTGRIDVTIEDQGEFYEIAVQDDGPGIPEKFHEQVFKMFQTLKPRDQVEGSGMGLAMVRKTVEVFGGTLRLESAEGKGSIFRFTWPKHQRIRRAAA